MGDQRNIKTLHTSFAFLLPLLPLAPTCASAVSHFEAHLKPIYEFTTQCFKGSHWRRYMKTTAVNGVEVGRQLHYDVTLQSSSLAPCSCALSALVHGITASATDAIYGHSLVHFE